MSLKNDVSFYGLIGTILALFGLSIKENLKLHRNLFKCAEKHVPKNDFNERLNRFEDKIDKIHERINTLIERK